MLQICKGASYLKAALIQEMRKREEDAGQKDCQLNAEALKEKSEFFKTVSGNMCV